jgi:putative tryptophan/tyrosine transport system ATP-binding protein
MLRLEALRRVFRSGPDLVVALSGIDLHLQRGDFLTVIGSNGAGKTTLLNLVAGTIPPTTGRVWIGGQDVTAQPAHRRARRIGRIVQDPLAGTAPTMTIAENLALASRRAGRTVRLALPRRRRAEFVDRVKTLGMGLERRLDDPVSLLSGGERQALTVTMATLSRPDILLLDEHTAALDPANAAAIASLTQRFVADLHLTTVMVTHNMEQAIALGNRLAMMHKGEILMELRGLEKARMRVEDLIALFARRHITEDELLLERLP